ncbi:MAG: alpha-E domain-containing protein, partial [Armatimonadota bacterium]|nr:alpha-E domain-containing protein [Armatimonadota bacterium]
RASHTANLLDINLNLALDDRAGSGTDRWTRLVISLHTAPPAISEYDAYEVVRMLGFDLTNRSSILACIATARENARQVREQITTEMWEQLNRLYLQIRDTTIEDIWSSQPHDFFSLVRGGVYTFQGITDSTLNHGEIWRFMQLGRFLERAYASSALLDVQLCSLMENQDDYAGPENYLEAVALLRSCRAFEAFCKVYTADMRPDWIAEFLLLNPDFPRSLCYVAHRVAEALQAISATTATTRGSKINRLAGRFEASLEFGQIDEIMEGGLKPFVRTIRQLCTQIHEGIYESYITYPVDSSIAA